MAASGRDIKGYPYAHSISHLQCVWQNKFLKKKTNNWGKCAKAGCIFDQDLSLLYLN